MFLSSFLNAVKPFVVKTYFYSVNPAGYVLNS